MHNGDSTTNITCDDCRVDTIINNEWYMLKDEIWFQAIKAQPMRKNNKTNDILCIGCVEKRLGRKLTHVDFLNVFLNLPEFIHSDRLQDRLKGFEFKFEGGLHNECFNKKSIFSR